MIKWVKGTKRDKVFKIENNKTNAQNTVLPEKWLKLQYNSLISVAACIIGHYLAACIICLYLRPVSSASICGLYYRPLLASCIIGL
jgi:hypothetical protein